MRAKQITFNRPASFVENGVPLTPAQMAAANYVVSVASNSGGTRDYTVPAAFIAGESGPVTVPFAALGFAPVPGVQYYVQVLVEVDGVQSSASPAVTFTNSYTPAAPDSVSVS